MNIENKIIAATCDFSGYHGTLGRRSDWLQRKNRYINNLQSKFHCNPDKYIFGVRYCELMFEELIQNTDNCSELLYRVNLSIDDSKKVSFVVPSVHQCRWDKFKRFCFNFIFPCIENGTINEIIVNDIGTLLFIRTEGPKNVRISLGRSWDKTTRECRFNIYDLIDFKNNQSMIEKPSLAGAFYLDFYKKYIIAGAEIDTPPDINLSIPKINGFTWNVIYPKIVVSRSSFCELGSYATKETPFVLNNCGKTCQKYYKQSHIIEARELMKIENTICYEQKRIPNDFIDGEYRLVYSEIF